jgi:hypothetical protein
MSRISILALLMLVALQALGQKPDTLETRTLAKGRIFLVDSETPLDAKWIVITNDSIRCSLSESKEHFSVQRQQVKMITQMEGHYGLTGAIIGGLGGVVAGVAVALGTKEEETKGYLKTTTYQTWPIAVFGGLGSLVGYAIGRSAETWKKVYPSESSEGAEVSWGIGAGPGGATVALRVTF